MVDGGAILECVPNFSEGRDPVVIERIRAAIAAVDGVRVLGVDPGRATNRTVMTFVGPPEAVVEAAFRAIAAAAELIDMRRHQGEHPRLGATDVCPLVPIRGLDLAEAAAWARRLGERVGRELGIPVYLYEAAASSPERRGLEAVRAGEYEGLPRKLADPAWAPDYGPATFLPASGATVIGARDFLVAYNVNLNSRSSRRAFAVAYDVREQGRPLREGDPITGPVVLDERGAEVWQPGRLRGVKAIGWYIEDYGIAQVSMNITRLSDTPLHLAFEACRDAARERGMRVTGSELVGLVPLAALLDAGRFYLARQRRSLGVPEAELVQVAVASLGLDDLAPFDPRARVIEYAMRAQEPAAPELAGLSLRDFSASLASEHPAPGGGSVAALLGALAGALGAMVANVSANKRGWDDRWERFSAVAQEGEAARVALLGLIDADSRAFEAVLAAGRMPRAGAEDEARRSEAMGAALRQAVEVPLAVMRAAAGLVGLLEAMAAEGAPQARSDALVGLLCAQAAVRGAGLNVRTNLSAVTDAAFASASRAEASALEADVAERVSRALPSGA